MDDFIPKSTIGLKFRLYILVTRAYDGGGPEGEIPLASCACLSKQYQTCDEIE
jgi:hypothetical protein